MKKRTLFLSLLALTLVACNDTSESQQTGPNSEANASENSESTLPASESLLSPDTEVTEPPASETVAPIVPDTPENLASEAAWLADFNGLSEKTVKSLFYTRDGSYTAGDYSVSANTSELLISHVDSDGEASYDYNGIYDGTYYAFSLSDFSYGSRSKIVADASSVKHQDEITEEQAKEQIAALNADIFSNVVMDTDFVSYQMNNRQWSNYQVTYDDEDRVFNVTYHWYKASSTYHYDYIADLYYSVTGALKRGTFDKAIYNGDESYDVETHTPLENAATFGTPRHTSLLQADFSDLEAPGLVPLYPDLDELEFVTHATGADDISVEIGETVDEQKVTWADWEPSVLPANTVDGTSFIYYATSVSDSAVLQLNEDGTCTALTAGTSTITFGNAFTSNIFTVFCTVTAAPDPSTFEAPQLCYVVESNETADYLVTPDPLGGPTGTVNALQNAAVQVQITVLNEGKFDPAKITVTEQTSDSTAQVTYNTSEMVAIENWGTTYYNLGLNFSSGNELGTTTFLVHSSSTSEYNVDVLLTFNVVSSLPVEEVYE